MYSVSRNDVKTFAKQIETLARTVQDNIDNNTAFLTQANELVCKCTSLVFTLGEVYAVEQTSVKTKSTVSRKSNPNFYNVRDSKGRFTRV
jgi:transcription initiation factor IIE alpha subunit